MDDYKISKTTRACGKCETGFAEGDSFFSTVLDTTEGLHRMDFCPKCWEAVTDEEKTRLFSFWKAGNTLSPTLPLSHSPSEAA